MSILDFSCKHLRRRHPGWIWRLVATIVASSIDGSAAERPDIPIVYGLVHARSAPNNPFVIAYEELWQTLKTALQSGTARQRLVRLWSPP